MTRESEPGDDDIVAVGASGLGVMAIVVGAHRGFITRQEAIERLLRITGFLATANRFHGAWPHFLSGRTGHMLPVFDMYDDGADLVETSFLMEGLLTARQCFKDDGPSGHELYERITKLWQGVDWNWFRAAPKQGALYWHWSPDFSFYIANRLPGWNEVMITYLEAIASPTHPIPASDYYSGWVGEGIGNKYANGKTYDGIKLEVGGGTGGPLFFTDYSFMGFDPRGRHDRFTDYYDNNRAQAMINYQYCIHNPHHWKGYGANDWGLTAVDGPEGYVPYANLSPRRWNDGTDWGYQRVSLYTAPIDGRAQAFLPRLGGSAVGYLWISRRLQPPAELVFRHHYGSEPGFHCGNDRKLPQQSHMAQFHGEFGNSAYARQDWISTRQAVG